MSDNSEPNPTQTELTSTEQLVGLVPIQAEEQNIGVQLIEGADEDFFGSQAIELNGERHVIVSQAQDPETGELLLVLRGENGEHIAIQPEALSSMVQASGGENIQVAVESTEASLTIASDMSSLSHSVTSELSSALSTSLSALPSIIASIPSQTQTSTAPTNVVQAIDTPRVSQEEQPSSLTTTTVSDSVAEKSEIAKQDKPEPPVEKSSKEEKPEKVEEEKKKEEISVEKKTEIEVPSTDANEAPKPTESETSNKEEESDLPSVTESKEATKPVDETTKEDLAKTNEEKSETETIPEKITETVDKTKEKAEETEKSSETIAAPELSNGLPNSSGTIKSHSTSVSSDLVESTSSSTTTTTTPIISSVNTSIADVITTSAEKNTKSSNDSTDIGFGNAVIQVQDSNTDASLEQLMANAVLTADGNYVLMAQTEDGQVTGLPPELNLSDMISAGAAGGQTFLIETPEGLVACTAASSGEDGAIQLIPTEAGDLESAVISSAQSGGVENQIIQAISGGGAMSYTINTSTGCLELTPAPAAQTSTTTTPSKPARGNRNTRPSKPKVIPNIPSGQTLLLATETVSESPTVTTKSLSTTSRSRNTNPKNKGGRGGGTLDSGVNLNDSAISANVQQIKSNAKTATEAKSGTTLGNNVSQETSTPPGPSQLAASRRTYSKKSNIVWITPDASQGANSTAFATVATASVKSSNTSQPQQKQKMPTNLNSSVNKPTVQTSSPVKASSPSKSTFNRPIQSISSPTKETILPLTTNTSQSKASVQSTPTTVTISKSSTVKTSGADKNTSQSSQPTDKKGATKTTAMPTVTKAVTASKTTITMKSSSQPSASKGQTPNLKIESSIDSKILTKTPIRMSDITSPKPPTPVSPTKPTATKTVVTVSSSKDKTTAVAKTVAQKTVTPKSIAPLPTSNKTSSVPKPTTITVGSVATPKQNTSSKQGIASAKSAQSVSEAVKSDNSEKLVTKGKTEVEVKVNSTAESQSNVGSDATASKTKTTDKTAKKAPEKTVTTRHSARLSPSKSTKPESISVTSKETVKQNADDSQLDTKTQSAKINEEKEETKSKPEPAVDETVTKPKQSAAKESALPPPPQTVEITAEKDSKQESKDDSKSSRKSRRGSRNAVTIDESKKESKTTEESEANETKPKETKEKVKEKEKPAVEAVITRRSSGRQKAIKEVAVSHEEKPPTTEAAIPPQPETPQQTVTETPTQETLTPIPKKTGRGRYTRASRGKASEAKVAKTEEPISKTPEAKSKTESIEKSSKPVPEKKDEIKVEKEVVDKPIPEKEITVESKEPIGETVSETPTVTRSVKKRVQFEVKEKPEEREKVKEIEEKSDKSKESTPKSTRRSLRSATPSTGTQVQNDAESNQKDVKSDETNSESKTNNTDESANKTPQRVSTRKRKEVIKTPEPEEEKPAKTPRRGARKADIVNQNSATGEQKSEPTASAPRLKGRKSWKLGKRIELGIGSKESARHSIDSSETFARTARKQSLVQSYVDEDEWQEKEADLRRKTISSLSDLRSPNECYEYSTNDCRFYIRHQSSSVSPKQSAGNYLCQKCGFHTTRINNLVIHHRDQCSYIKNAVIQQWQTVQAELQAKRGRTADSALTASTSTPDNKRRKTENNDDFNHLDKHTDESELESEDERHDELANNDRNNQNPTISDIDAMLMASDDEDLLSIDNLDNPKRVFGFAEDDIVWVDTNDMHWPALVSKVFTKEKKALIRLIDSPWPKKSLKVSTSSISPFDSAEVNNQYLRDGAKPGNTGDILVKAVQKAEEFLRKKCLGSEVSAAKFFDSESETNVDDDERVSSSQNRDIAKETPKSAKESSVEGSASAAIESNGDELEIDKLPESSEEIAQCKEKRRQQNAKLLQCIKDGRVETHLVGVYRGSISSERHQKFLSGSESEKNQLKAVPWFGPIDDEEQQEEIYDYCSLLFKSNFKTEGSFDTVAYIFEVWVPEAIVKAISRVRRIELKDSEAIFAKGVSLSKSEKDELTKEIQKEAEKQLTSKTTSD